MRIKNEVIHAIEGFDYKPHVIKGVERTVIGAVGDGLMIEVHNCPEKALSDGPQALKPSKFSDLMGRVPPLAELMDRSL